LLLVVPLPFAPCHSAVARLSKASQQGDQHRISVYLIHGLILKGF